MNKKTVRWGTFTLSKDLIDNYNAGKVSFSEVKKAIGKAYGNMLVSNWAELLESYHNVAGDESVKAAGRYIDFWKLAEGETITKNNVIFSTKFFGANLNLIFDRTTDLDPTKQEIIKDFGPDVDFIMWQYDSVEKAMFLVKDDIRYEVKLVDDFDSDYQSETMVYTKIGV